MHSLTVNLQWTYRHALRSWTQSVDAGFLQNVTFFVSLTTDVVAERLAVFHDPTGRLENPTTLTLKDQTAVCVF